MKCDKENYDAITCNKILDASEKLILEHGILSFCHTKIVKDYVCSARKFYSHFSSREDILICLLLRRTVTYEIESFLQANSELPVIAKLFVPSLMTFEVSRIDELYLKACLTATNIGVWQVAHEEKQQKLKVAEQRYIQTINNVVNEAIIAGELKPDCFEHIVNDLYYYNMGKLTALGSIIAKNKSVTIVDQYDAESLLALTSHYRNKQNLTSTLILRVYELIKIHLSGDRNISCEHCHYFKGESSCKQ
jgi:hypothetical protein